MSTSKVTVPDFDFTGFYYPQLLEAAIRWMRANVPEITSETPSDPAIQLLRAYALMGHLNNVLLDQVAHEAMFPTAQLRDSLVQHLKLIGFSVNADVPAVVDIVATLPKSYDATTTVVAQNTLFATKKTATREPIVYEALEPVTIKRTDFLTKAFHYKNSTDTYTDITSAVNSSLTDVVLLPATPNVGDAVYFGHDSVMTNRLRFDKIITPMDNVFGVWEFSDTNLEDGLADTVTQPAATVLRVVVNSVLDSDGTTLRTGQVVRVFYNKTGVFEDCAVLFDAAFGGNYVQTTSLLGQTGAPSLTASDYTVGSNWLIVEGLDDDTNAGNTTMEQKGNLDFIVPQSTNRDWSSLSIRVDGAGTMLSCFWLRFRVTQVAVGASAPRSGDRIRWDKRDNFVKLSATQGQTRTQDPLASSDGSANQTYLLSTTPVIQDSIKAYVNTVEWTQVSNFLSSTALDNHFTAEIDSDGQATIKFGDGSNGKIPPSGINNIGVVYRTGADLDGNVGANTILVNRSGSSNIKKVTNPRPASGWNARRGATETDRTKLKLEGPASIRTLSKAVTVEDIEYLSTQFKTSDGRTPVLRAKAIEAYYGPKTIGLFVTGTGGALLSAADLAELQTYFNGDAATSVYGVLVVNHEVTANNYTGVPINITATTIGGDKAKIEAALAAFIGPVTLEEDGLTYHWDFGEDVPVSKIIASILGCDVDTGDVLDVTVTSPAGTVAIADYQLPTLGTLNITVT